MTRPPETSALERTIAELDSVSQSFSVRISFRTPSQIKFSSAVAFRGLLGKILLLREPDLITSFFKPESKTSLPPPFAVRLVPPEAPARSQPSVRFLLSMIARDQDLPRRIASLIRSGFPGESFGSAGIESVSVVSCRGGPAHLPPDDPSGAQCLYSVSMDFITPARIPRHGVIVGPLSFSPAFVAASLAEKLNTFSAAYGYGSSVPVDELVAKAALLIITEKNIRHETQQRISGCTGQRLFLDGCAGSISFDRCPADLLRLFRWGFRFGAGRHCSAGSGMYFINAVRS